MNAGEWIAAVLLILGAIGGAVKYLSTRRDARYDQLQEDVGILRSEIKDLRTEVKDLRADRGALYNYASELRGHIFDQKPPPPPPWPHGLG
ncbi:hypothetical protein [Nakamurella lactea]|uniref:hypothetical protein n=1 Tax=Nakamurella lactea TaxID=459515 RepID=UPI0003F7B24B|nr:hypothetical protein [Nakamurella lactea]